MLIVLYTMFGLGKCHLYALAVCVFTCRYIPIDYGHCRY